MKSALHLSCVSCIVFFFVSTSFAEKSPYTKADGSWIRLEGYVSSADDNHFMLDYGKGVVIVEMDDWDWYKEGRNLLEGDEVVVYGVVDDDMYETTSIEASSVYVKNLNTYFYANAIDEEDVPYVFSTVFIETDYNVTGTVTSTSSHSFTLDTGKRKLSVSTDEMAYNPMDKYGFQKIEKGDRVSVSGDITENIFDKKVLEAKHIVTLIEDEGSS